MSEKASSDQEPGRRPAVSPYNLDEFPQYEEDLLRATTDPNERADIRLTFNPKNVEELEVLTDPEFSHGLSAEQHEKLFDELYPALSTVYRHDERIQGATERRDMALQKEREQKDNPRAYGNYWRTTQEQNQEEDAVLAEICRNNQRRLEQAQAEMFRSGASLDTASEWYLRLGALSRLEGAEEMLVYAADLPVDRKKRAEYPPEEQQLYSGCMLMEASLINDRSQTPDTVRQEQYEQEAWSRFEALAKGSPDSQEAYLAKVYLSDLQLRQAGRMLTEARSKGDEELTVQAHELAKGAQDSLGALLEATNAARTKLDQSKQAVLRGREVELSVLWLLRERYLNRENPSKQKGLYDTHYAHQAFPRQDWPKDGMLPNHQPRHSYDTEVVVKSERGVGIIPIQVKGSEAGKGEGYDHRVVMMVDSERKTDDIVKALVYRRRKISGGAQRVAELSAGIERALVSRLNEKRAARAARG